MNANFSRLDLYIKRALGPSYTNTPEEQELVEKFAELYAITKAAQEKHEEASVDNLDKWRRAYNGTLGALTKDGVESKRKSRQLRKVAYEIVESVVDNSIPMPKMQPRYKNDVPLVSITEDYLKFEADRILTTYINDSSERSTYIDGTGWYKIWWDSLDNTHERSGDVKIDYLQVDQVFPQPGVKDYHQLEYIFERSEVSISRIYDLYGKVITPINGDTNLVTIVSCYYLNENRTVGLFCFAEASRQVICNEHDWQIRKLRKCTKCGTIVPREDVCPMCGNKHFKYENAEKEILENDLVELYKPYDVAEREGADVSGMDPEQVEQKVFLKAGTEIPFYRLTQLPFVPRPCISIPNSVYGKSVVSIVLEMQDGINKVLSKGIDKTLKSGAVVTKPEKIKMGDNDDSFKVIGVRTQEESTMIQVKQIMADTSEDLAMASILYESSKSSSGVTDSYQGNRDTTATSGKAKEYAALQAAGRIESMRVMKASAFSGVYELLFKYLLAFSDETRRFVRTLPNGKQTEEAWSKYMFLDKDKYGTIFYRDDFTFRSDPASSLSQNRSQMWQETTNKFIQGAFGVPNDPRTLKLYWNTMDSLSYPLAKIALAGIMESEQHLPADIEQAIMQNPEAMQAVMSMLQDGRGGARANAGQKGNGATHAANVERTNTKNSMANKSKGFTPQSGSVSTVGQSGGLQ